MDPLLSQDGFIESCESLPLTVWCPVARGWQFLPSAIRARYKKRKTLTFYVALRPVLPQHQSKLVAPACLLNIRFPMFRFPRNDLLSLTEVECFMAGDHSDIYCNSKHCSLFLYPPGLEVSRTLHMFRQKNNLLHGTHSPLHSCSDFLVSIYSKNVRTYFLCSLRSIKKIVIGVLE